MLIGVDASRAVVPQRTGTENYSLYLIRALLQEGAVHRFRLYFNRAPEPGLFLRDERVEWRVMPFPRLWTHIRLAWEVTRRPPDVLFVPAHVLPLAHPRHCVATVHDLGYLHYPEAHTPFARRYLDWATRFNARVAQRVIVDSKATRDDLAACYGVDPAKMVVAYPAGAEGMQPVTDEAVLEQTRRRYGTGPRYILYVGTIQPRKNLETLLRAFAAWVAEQPMAADVRLVIVGKQGWLYEQILALARSLEVAGRVVFTGYAPAEDLPALLSGALAYVLPSWYEGFGLPVLEAMACDTPVICSNVSSLPEVAGDAALLFDPADARALTRALDQVCSDQELRLRMIERGRRQVQAFSWQRCAQQVLGALVAAVG
ncbi:MAG: glycosyltransferase family 4 protein [Chloroflexi bacterium]|jgi:glycosyltransferase involved in cell wall biosynthesis|nr:glycosyltransferase family 4 protein [Chloroflexota bacterium]